LGFRFKQKERSFVSSEENPMIPQTLKEVEVLIFDNPVAHVIQKRVVGFQENESNVGRECSAENRKHGGLRVDDCIGGASFGAGEQGVELVIHAGKEFLFGLNREENNPSWAFAFGEDALYTEMEGRGDFLPTLVREANCLRLFGLNKVLNSSHALI
jgi:hypothetical protein